MMDKDTAIAGLQAELEQARMRINELEVRLEGFVNAARIEANAVAIRQREACAGEARFYAGFGWDGEKVEEKVRATPLVTETK
jgi:hypothetical protein